ncbi:MAG: hypothetical protein OEY34_07325 [Cyclobacteriaceae bacterium]|nr:hypothetical protein [Cyclobacteriaceae bacterium]
MSSLKVISFLVSFKYFFVSLFTGSPGIVSENSSWKLDSIGKFTPILYESSGLLVEDSLLYTHRDSGFETLLFICNLEGKIIDTLSFNGLKTQDWEDITRDDNNDLYLGDLGNNQNSRQDLTIYKVDYLGNSESIAVSYANQKMFPPSRKKWKNFDSEGLVYFQDSLLLFSKNRGIKWVKVYKVPAKKGNYSLLPTDSIYLHHPVTGAAISPDKRELALLAYGKIYFFPIEGKIILYNKGYSKKFIRSGQAEGIAWVDEKTIVISNERGILYYLSKSDKNTPD